MNTRQYIRSFLVAALLMATITGQSKAQNFSETCRNISLQGKYLSAVCMTSMKCTPGIESPCICDFLGMNCRIGRPTAIDLNQGISNLAGALKFKGTNFSTTCSNLHLEVKSGYEVAMPGSVTLHAKCKTGGLLSLDIPAALDLNTGLSNNKGVLLFDQ